MRLAERRREPAEAHFTEGELDLEPPEELAIGELDDQTMLEEELDNEDLLEQDVDEDTLEVTLEHLVHEGDAEGEEDPDSELHEAHATFNSVAPRGLLDTDDSEVGIGDEELEEGLDLVLLERLALVGEDRGDDEDEREVVAGALADTVDLVDVAPRGSDEFVCRSCFLVRTRLLLVDPGALVCRDCST